MIMKYIVPIQITLYRILFPVRFLLVVKKEITMRMVAIRGCLSVIPMPVWKGYEIIIPRLECNSCGHSHALLAPVIIPYSPFSFHFVISLLYDYMTHRYDTVAALCQVYDISISSLYRIFHRFTADRKLMLGMMEAAVTQAYELLNLLADNRFTEHVDLRLNDFFKRNHASFLQARCRIRLKPKPITVCASSSP
jgi:hypothetical protein